MSVASISSLSLLALAALSDVTAAAAGVTVKNGLVKKTFSDSNSMVKRDMDRPQFGDVPYGEEVISCKKPGVIALTFDDGPGKLTEDIVKTLNKYDAKATFFVVGKNGNDGLTTGDYDDLIKDMYDAGHQIGSHSFSHPDFSSIDHDEIVEELEGNEKALADIIGVTPTYFRPPYTSCDEECYETLGEMGYHVTDYDLDTKDWDAQGANSEALFKESLLEADSKKDSFVALAHDIQKFTASTLVEFMLKLGEAQGFEFVTLGECLGDPEGNWYRDPETGKAAGGDSSSSSGDSKEAVVTHVFHESTSHVAHVSSVTVTSSDTTFVTDVTSSIPTMVTASSQSTLAEAAEATEESESDSDSDSDDDDDSAGVTSSPSLARAIVGSVVGVAAWMLL